VGDTRDMATALLVLSWASYDQGEQGISVSTGKRNHQFDLQSYSAYLLDDFYAVPTAE
jgi:hypothetical protein